jgi:hypothetical protein
MAHRAFPYDSRPTASRCDPEADRLPGNAVAAETSATMLSELFIGRGV